MSYFLCVCECNKKYCTIGIAFYCLFSFLAKMWKDSSVRQLVRRSHGDPPRGRGTIPVPDTKYMRSKEKKKTQLLRKYWRRRKKVHRAKTRVPPPYERLLGIGDNPPMKPPPFKRTRKGVQVGGSMGMPTGLPAQQQSFIPPTPNDIGRISHYVRTNYSPDGNRVLDMDGRLGEEPSFMPAQGEGVPGGVSEDVVKASMNAAVPENEIIVIKQGDRPAVFQHPTQIMLGGPTKSGKTTLMQRLLENRATMFQPPIERVYWYYTMDNSVAGAKTMFPDVIFVKGTVTSKTTQDMELSRPTLLIMDDMQDMVLRTDTFTVLSNLFTRESHHSNLSVALLVQDFFIKRLNQIAAQCENVIAMLSGSSSQKLESLGRRMFSTGGGAFLLWATQRIKAQSKWPYALMSQGAGVSECEKLRHFIFPGEANTFYVQKGTLQDRMYLELKQHEKEEVPTEQQLAPQLPSDQQQTVPPPQYGKGKEAPLPSLPTGQRPQGPAAPKKLWGARWREEFWRQQGHGPLNGDNYHQGLH